MLVFKDMRVFYPCLCFFAAAASLFARDIIFVIQDSGFEMPLEGAVVRFADGREFVSGVDGTVRFYVPDSQTINVSVSYPGYKAERVTINAQSSGRILIKLRTESFLENKELIFTVEKEREQAVVETGRSVTIGGKELARTAKVGFIEDVMTSVKLLPGVGYSGMFNAMPSIRGGEPGDLVAALDGFYIENAYFWGGGISIFDPRMVESAKLSHGIFSSRYGHTISGLLEITSKKPSATEIELELGISSSAFNLNLSIPLRRGGIMVMGKVTYWGGYVALLKALADVTDIEELDAIYAITTVPYIRAAAFSGNYQLTSNSEISLNGFIGGDGMGADYKNRVTFIGGGQDVNLTFDWDNLQGFLIAGGRFNPKNEMLIKSSIGAGFRTVLLAGDIYNSGAIPIKSPWTPDDLRLYFPGIPNARDDPSLRHLDNHYLMDIEGTTTNMQGRIDFDWELPKGFLFAAGAQEFFNLWTRSTFLQGMLELSAPRVDIFGNPLPPSAPDYYINRQMTLGPTASKSHALSSAAYTLLEYKTPNKKFGSELGLRLDHFFVAGDDFSIQSMPAFNPRINLDFNVLKNKSIFDSIDLTAGSGLFSSMTDDTSGFNKETNIKDFELKQNRSWTSLFGAKINFLNNYSFNIEGYYKYVFDRHYSVTVRDAAEPSGRVEHYFDGESRIAGFDVMLQKLHSKYIDGWISYTFVWARFHNSIYANNNGDIFTDDNWRWPSYHRFHNLNVVMNIKPTQRFNISLRVGFASGVPRSKAGEVTAYPVLVMRDGNTSFFMQRYKRPNYYSDSLRDGFTIPVDIKLSFLTFQKNGKSQGELYLAVEGLLAFLKTRESNGTFDQWTGEEVEGSDTANYQMPVPMISFGYTWSY